MTDKVIDLAAPFGRDEHGEPLAPHGRKANGAIRRQHGKGQGLPPGSVIGSKGDGWGGPAKGCGNSAPIGPKPENMRPIQLLPPERQLEVREAKAYREMSEQEVAMEMRQKLLDLARSAERPETQMAAAIALDNRVSGTPKAHIVSDVNISDMSGLSDDELATIEAIAVKLAIGHTQ